jgi:hypothetical protein
MLCILLLAALLAPFTYFAWRVTRPMSMPEFKGLSYIQFLAERQDGYDLLADTYQASHPHVQVKRGMCFGSELAVEITYSWLVSGLYTLADVSPSVKSHIDPRAISLGLLPEHVGAWSFLPAWWETFEKMVWGLSEHARHGPVAYCRLATP